ncbi:MAG TPA: transcription antitermination factor NusB [Gemmatimonadaceae bacterium]
MRLSRYEQRVRRRARARTLQALYAWDVAPDGDLDQVSDRLWSDLAVGEAERALAAPIVHEVATRREEIDAVLASVTTNWRLDRLGAIERSVLRLAVAELLLGQTPPRVVIQEAVRLAERFGSAESARFVNGVLDAVARRLGSL